MKNNIATLLLLLVSFACFGQKEISWDDLARVKYTDKYFPAFDEYFLFPTFSPEIQALEGKEITITGYFLNIDPRGELYILSMNPMASCFFCGVGGPETAMELNFVSKPNFKTDDVITVTGVLKLNDADVEHFNYILTQCHGQLVNQ